MKPHRFDPISFVIGLFVAGAGLFFLVGDRTIAEVGPGWIWPFPVLLVGLIAVLHAIERMRRRPADDPVVLPHDDEPDDA